MLLSDRNGVRVRMGRKGMLGMGDALTGVRRRALAAHGVLRRDVLEGLSSWPHPTGVCATMANDGRLLQRPGWQTPRRAYASMKPSSRSVYASRAIARGLTRRLVSRPCRGVECGAADRGAATPHEEEPVVRALGHPPTIA
jgi:hypothetical protein